MEATEATLEINFPSKIHLCDEALEKLFIFFTLLYKGKDGYNLLLRFLLPKVAGFIYVNI